MIQAAEATAEQTHVMSGEQAVCAVKANSGRGQGHKGRGVPVPFQIDSGSERRVLPRNEYVKVTGDRSLPMLRPVKTVIVTYNGTREKSLGQCKLSVVRKGAKHRLVFNVLQGKYTPILSLDASEGMGVLKIKDSDPLDYVYNTRGCTSEETNCLCCESRIPRRVPRPGKADGQLFHRDR